MDGRIKLCNFHLMERSKYVFIFSKSSGILEHKITYLKGAILNILVLIPMYFRRNDKSLRLTLLSFVNMRSPPLYITKIDIFYNSCF